MTRPSEAEVTEAMVEAAMTTFGFSSDPNPSRSAHWVKCAIRAALSTPPLPSAPERVLDDECGDGMTWADVREKVARALADAKKYELRVAFLRRTFAPLPSAEPVAFEGFPTMEQDSLATRFPRTTPPAAAQDTGPKDEAVRWLAILLAGEYDTEWQDAEGVPLPDLSQSCRDLLDAARAAGGE